MPCRPMLVQPSSTLHAVPGVTARTALRYIATVAVMGACAGPDAAAPLAAPVEIGNPAPPGSGEPNLSAAPDGSALLTWIEAVPGAGHRLRFSRLRDGEWTDPRTIAEGRDLFVNWADFPSLIELPGGRLVAHFLQRDAAGSGYGIRLTQSTDDGVGWSEPLAPYRVDAPADYGFVSLFPTAGDRTGVIWLDGRSFDPEFGGTNEVALRYTTLAADGTLGPEQLLDLRVCDCCQTAAAITSAGPVVAYRGRAAGEIRDISLVRMIGEKWSEPAVVHDDGWRLAACPVNGPAAAADGSLVTVAWFTAATGDPAVHVAISSDAGASFAPPLRVDEGDPLGRVAVALGPDRSIYVAWLERSGPLDADVRYRRISPDGRISRAVTVGAMRSRTGSGFPSITSAGDRLIFAWTEPGTDGGVRTAVLEP